MSINKIKQIAQNFIENNNFEGVDFQEYKYKLGSMKEHEDVIFFWIKHDFINEPSDNGSFPTGVPGIVIDKKTYKADFIIWGEFQELFKDEFRQKKLLELLIKLQKNYSFQFIFKSILGLNSSKLNLIKKEIKNKKIKNDFVENLYYSLDEKMRIKLDYGLSF